MKLDKWQEEVLKAKGDILLCTGRRVGKTYILARKAINKMVKEPETPIVVMSLTEDQAFIIINMALNYLKEEYPKVKYRSTMREIDLVDNKSKMISRPAGDTGEGVRGFAGGVLIVDEASRMKRLFWLAAKPILLTTDGDIWMGSTPFGKEGYFWDRFNEAYNLKREDARFKVFYKSTVDVINERPVSESWTEKQKNGALRILKLDKEEMLDIEFSQEYLGLFLDDLRQFFDEESIRSCMTLQEKDLPLTSPQNLFMGIDCASGIGRDETVFLAVKRINRERIRMVELRVSTKYKLPEQLPIAEDMDIEYNFKKIFIDGIGLGKSLVQYMEESIKLRRKVVELNNTKRTIKEGDDEKKIGLKAEDWYINLRRLIETNKIELFNDPRIMKSLLSIQSEKTSNGTLRFFGSYNHIAEALVRAAWCIKDKSLNILPFCR